MEEFLDPYEIAKNGVPSKGEKFDVGGLWSSENFILESHKKAVVHGYGSYLFKVVGLNKYTERLAFELSPFSTAYKLFLIDGNRVTLLNSAGKVGKSESESIPSFQKKIESFELKSDEFYILIHCSDFHYRSGGFFEPIVLGNYKTLKKDFEAY